MLPIAIAALFSAVAIGAAYPQAQPCGVQGSDPASAERCPHSAQADARSRREAPSPPAGARRGLVPQDVRGRPAVPIEMDRHPGDLEGGPAGPTLPSGDQPGFAPPATHPSPITACDPGGCWDSGGLRYNGTGNAMIRSDGKVCQQIGNMMHCN